MPSKESLGIAQVEVYDAALHPDATFFTGEQMSSHRACRKGPIINHKIVEKDPFDNDVNIVWERWCPILKKVGRADVSAKMAAVAVVMILTSSTDNQILGRHQGSRASSNNGDVAASFRPARSRRRSSASLLD